jgi:hypothetical protein
MNTSSTVKNSYWLHCFLREIFLKPKKKKKQGVCQTLALPIYIKKYLKAKEELQKLKYFTMQKYNIPKIL